MPYKSPPAKIKKLPKHAQDIWVSAFNSAWKQYNGDEEKCNKVAWNAVKQKYHKVGEKWSKMEGETTSSSLDPKGITVSKTFATKKKKKKKEETKMGKTAGIRDGNGPAKGSYQDKTKGIGKRKEKGEPCPKKKGEKKMKKMSKFVKWSTKEKGSLPDSAFAVVYGEGDKKVRKLPYKDNEGKVDVPHLRNALVRVAQGKTTLSPALRARAQKKLKGIAGKYLKTYKETKSGEIMSQSISKFEADVEDRLSAIVKLLKEKATNRKPEDEISFEVKALSLLIQDLEEIVDLEKARKDTEKEETEEETEDKDKEEKTEDKDTEKKEETKETEKKEETEKKPEEKKEESTEKETKEETKKEDKETEEKEDVEESKFQEAMKLCEGYRGELEKNQQLISKFQKEIDNLKEQNGDYTKQLSKFKQDSYSKLLNSTVEKISKFKGLKDEEKLNLKKHYLESKMSEPALEELGRITDEKMFSKLGEPKIVTKPSEQLEPANKEKDFSKMSSEEKLDMLSKYQAKARGFVE